MKLSGAIAERNIIKQMDWDEMKASLGQQVKNHSQFFETFLVVDTTGKAHTTGGDEFDISGRSYFREIIQEGKKTVVSNPLI